ncbi:MAG TPA: CRISPR-associated protein Cas4 [Sedimentisphaerales bacterium]|nr:CRISPR-associated protein Cas4 [Sedimentisphaerales bacterium]HRS10773.1 CRISPR-associated protein Cas4 [Sedimentisphaerales bacterium]HRV47478.1 CRISPR-associated protein Cas4 [Sedimentisphaerales bacterium]
MYTEDELIPVSALQHWMYCPRQCALIHIEQVWTENVFTAEGRGLHEKVHDAETETRDRVRIVRGLRLHSLVLGLVGQADVVEFVSAEMGTALPGIEGLWRPFPVEYKRGKPKSDASDEIQLCAQAMCLEEMLGLSISEGALFYGRPRRRKKVEFTEALRQETTHAAQQLHELFRQGQTPRVAYSKKCPNCSLVKVCMPSITGITKDIRHYLSKAGMDE